MRHWRRGAWRAATCSSLRLQEAGRAAERAVGVASSVAPAAARMAMAEVREEEAVAAREAAELAAAAKALEG